MSANTFILLQLVLWLSILAIFHSYVLYPLLLRILARKRANPPERYDAESPPGEWPYLVAVLAAHNEEAVLEETLTSLFNTDYPDDRFELLVAADNCSDRTVEIVEQFRDRHPNLRLAVYPSRHGKIQAVNRLLGEHRVRLSLEGDYLLLMLDANVRWSRDLPWRLAQHFRNPDIGMVAPVVLDDREEHRGIADEESSYVNRENRIKYHEGVLWGRMMGAFGATYALRGRLFEPVPNGFQVDDFFHTMRCFELGHDAIVEPKAVAYEHVSEEISEEFRRKRRIAFGNFQNLERFRRFLMPWHGGWKTSFAFWSHKGLRWCGPLFLAGALLSSAVLASQHGFYALALAGQIALFAAAATDAILARWKIHCRPLRFIRYFYLMNVALFLGGLRFLSGANASFWEPTRRVSEEKTASQVTTQENPPAPAASVMLADR